MKTILTITITLIIFGIVKTCTTKNDPAMTSAEIERFRENLSKIETIELAKSKLETIEALLKRAKTGIGIGKSQWIDYVLGGGWLSGTDVSDFNAKLKLLGNDPKINLKETESEVIRKLEEAKAKLSAEVAGR